jgi:methionyl aminopeptidase
MISIKDKNDIKAMREGGRILATIMREIEKMAVIGKSTMDLDKLAEQLVFAHGGVPAFKGYGAEMGNPFPATVCASLNSEIVHGIPSDKVILKDGNLLKIDIGIKYKGFCTDMARTFLIGEVSAEGRKLAEVTEQSFWEGVKHLSAGKKLSAYSRAVQEHVEQNGFSVVRNLVGHGVGEELHEDPQIPNYYNKKYQDVNLVAGMTLALEPMVNEGGFETKLARDGWAFSTRDGKLSAHYENTVLITEKGVEVLTII